MIDRVLSIGLALAVGCGGSSAPAEEPLPPPSPERAPVAEAEPIAEPAIDEEPEPPPPAEPARPTDEEIAAAVQARVEGLPRPPIDGTRPLVSVTRGETRRLCQWMSRLQGERRETSCPDGSRVTVGAQTECTPTQYAAFEGCTLTVFEMAACMSGIAAAPCEAGLLGDRLPECQPFLACMQHQMRAAQQQQAAPPE